jgi:hypothetical protein
MVNWRWRGIKIGKAGSLRARWCGKTGDKREVRWYAGMRDLTDPKTFRRIFKSQHCFDAHIFGTDDFEVFVLEQDIPTKDQRCRERAWMDARRETKTGSTTTGKTRARARSTAHMNAICGPRPPSARQADLSVGTAGPSPPRARRSAYPTAQLRAIGCQFAETAMSDATRGRPLERHAPRQRSPPLPS